MSESAANDLSEATLAVDRDLEKRVRDYLIQCHSNRKSWFKSKEIARSLGANPKSVGQCMRVIRQEDRGMVRIAEVWENSSGHRYKVDIVEGDDE